MNPILRAAVIRGLVAAVFVSGVSPARAAEPANKSILSRFTGFFKRSKTQSYLKSSRMAFALPRSWKGPVDIEGGVSYEHPSKRAKITARYLEKTNPDYMEPVAFRRWLREQGIGGDTHLLETITISSRTAYRARFREYYYPPEYVIGTRVRVDFVDFLMIPDPPDGVYAFRFDSALDDAARFGGAFDFLADTLVLPTGAAAVEAESKRDVLGRVVETQTLSGALFDKMKGARPAGGGGGGWGGGSGEEPRLAVGAGLEFWIGKLTQRNRLRPAGIPRREEYEIRTIFGKLDLLARLGTRFRLRNSLKKSAYTSGARSTVSNREPNSKLDAWAVDSRGEFEFAQREGFAGFIGLNYLYEDWKFSHPGSSVDIRQKLYIPYISAGARFKAGDSRSFDFSADYSPIAETTWISGSRVDGKAAGTYWKASIGGTEVTRKGWIVAANCAVEVFHLFGSSGQYDVESHLANISGGFSFSYAFR